MEQYLIPTRYATKGSSAGFEVADLTVSVSYHVENRRLLGFIPWSSVSRVTVQLSSPDAPSGAAADSDASGASAVPGTFAYQFPLPRQGKVGAEINKVQEGLYGLINRVLRKMAQERIMLHTEKQVRSLEEEIFLGNAKTYRDYLKQEINPEQDPRARTYIILNELAERLLTTLRGVTKVTSLHREGLEEYQSRLTKPGTGKKNGGLEQVIDVSGDAVPGESGDAAGRYSKELLYPLAQYLDSKLPTGNSQKECAVARQEALEYLQRFEETLLKTGQEPHQKPDREFLSRQQTEVVLKEFVEPYMALRQKRNVAVALPSNILGHAFESLVWGGLKGFVVISVLAETVINGIAGTKLDFPGFYIGAGMQFCWPYLSATANLRQGKRHYAQGLEQLVGSVESRLAVFPPAPESIVKGLLQETYAERGAVARRRREEKLKAGEINEKLKMNQQLLREHIQGCTPELLSTYSKIKSITDDNEDVVEAVDSTKKALARHKVLPDIALRIIPLLGRVSISDGVIDVAYATNAIIGKLGSLPSYDYAAVERLLTDLNRQRDFGDGCEDIAAHAIRLL